MDWTNPWIIGPLCVGGGIFVGMLLMRLVSRDTGRERALNELRGEFDEYRVMVKTHFDTTSELFQDMTEKYRDVYNHLAAGAQTFGDGDDTPPRLEIVRPEERLPAAATAAVVTAEGGAVDAAAPKAPDDVEAQGELTEHDTEPDSAATADDGTAVRPQASDDDAVVTDEDDQMLAHDGAAIDEELVDNASVDDTDANDEATARSETDPDKSDAKVVASSNA